MDKCSRCGADIDTETQNVCPRCGATVSGEKNIRVLVSLVIFCAAILLFLGLAAMSQSDKVRRTSQDIDTTPTPDKSVQSAPTTDIELDPGMVEIAIDETVDRGPAGTDMLASLLRAGFEEAGYGVSQVPNTAGLDDESTEFRAAMHVICETRSSSRTAMGEEGTEQYHASAAISVRLYDRSSGRMICTRKKSAGALARTRMEALDTARRKAMEPIMPEIIKSVERLRVPGIQPEDGS